MKIICPVCKVEIDGEVVNYSYGKPRDKKHLFHKVCKHAKVKGCINDFKGNENEDPFKFMSI